MTPSGSILFFNNIATERNLGAIGVIADPDQSGIFANVEVNHLLIEQHPYLAWHPGLYGSRVDSWYYRPDLCNAQPELLENDTVNCGDSVRLTVPWESVEYITHEWSVVSGEPATSTDTAVTVRLRHPGQHTVRLIYRSFDLAPDTVYSTITVLGPPPFADAGSDRSACGGDTLVFIGRGGDARRWLVEENLRGPDSDTLVVVARESRTLVLEALDSAGCIDYDTVTLTINPDPSVEPGRDRTICAGDSVRIAADAGNAIPGLRYRWLPSDGLDCDTCFAPMASPRESTTYRVTVTNESGCSATDSIRINLRERVEYLLTADTAICAGDSVALAVDGGVSWQWVDAPSLSCLDCPDPVAHPLTSTTYVVRIEGRNGCSVLDSVRVDVRAGDDLGVSADTTICTGGTALLRASGAVRYRWIPGDGLDCDTCATTNARPVRTTTYVVLGTSDEGECGAVDSVTVTVSEVELGLAGTDTTICGGSTVQLGRQVIGTIDYRWTPASLLDNPRSARPIAQVDARTIFVLHARDRVTGCEAFDTVTVDVLEGPPADAGPDLSICAGSTVELRALPSGTDTAGLLYRWSATASLDDPRSPRPTARPERTTDYIVSVEDPSTGCTSFDTVRVLVAEPSLIATRIDDIRRSYTGEPFAITIASDRIDPISGIRSIELDLRFDGRVMLAESTSIEAALRGTLLEGWDVEILAAESGFLSLRFTSPDGTPLSGEGDLAALTARLYLGEERFTEINYEIRVDGDCSRFTTSPGRAELDTICGFDLRLIEAGSTKYAPPRVQPNPTGSLVSIDFGIGLDGATRLEVFGTDGRRVALLLDEDLAAGAYRLSWDSTPDGSGIYWIRATSGSWSEVTRVVVE